MHGLGRNDTYGIHDGSVRGYPGVHPVLKLKNPNAAGKSGFCVKLALAAFIRETPRARKLQVALELASSFKSAQFIVQQINSKSGLILQGTQQLHFLLDGCRLHQIEYSFGTARQQGQITVQDFLFHPQNLGRMHGKISQAHAKQ